MKEKAQDEKEDEVLSEENENYIRGGSIIYVEKKKKQTKRKDEKPSWRKHIPQGGDKDKEDEQEKPKKTFQEMRKNPISKEEIAPAEAQKNQKKAIQNQPHLADNSHKNPIYSKLQIWLQKNRSYRKTSKQKIEPRICNHSKSKSVDRRFERSGDKQNVVKQNQKPANSQQDRALRNQNQAPRTNTFTRQQNRHLTNQFEQYGVSQNVRKQNQKPSTNISIHQQERPLRSQFGHGAQQENVRKKFLPDLTDNSHKNPIKSKLSIWKWNRRFENNIDRGEGSIKEKECNHSKSKSVDRRFERSGDKQNVVKQNQKPANSQQDMTVNNQLPRQDRQNQQPQTLQQNRGYNFLSTQEIVSRLFSSQPTFFSWMNNHSQSGGEGLAFSFGQNQSNSDQVPKPANSQQDRTVNNQLRRQDRQNQQPQTLQPTFLSRINNQSGGEGLAFSFSQNQSNSDLVPKPDESNPNINSSLGFNSRIQTVVLPPILSDDVFITQTIFDIPFQQNPSQIETYLCLGRHLPSIGGQIGHVPAKSFHR